MGWELEDDFHEHFVFYYSVSSFLNHLGIHFYLTNCCTQISAYRVVHTRGLSHVQVQGAEEESRGWPFA